MRVTKIGLHIDIYLVRFATQYELASTFIRIQEHYESKAFRGKVFTLEAYMDWYARTYGSFSYFEDWEGFNVPSAALDPFLKGDFDPLLDKERRLLDRFASKPRPFYMIGVATGGSGVIRHELAHALFGMVPAYRKEVLASLRGWDTRPLEERIRKYYAGAVVKDEVQADLISGGPRDNRPFADLAMRLRKTFNRYLGAESIRIADLVD